MLTDRSMMLPSRLISLFLKRNFFRPPWLRTNSWHFTSVCSNTVCVEFPRPILIGVGQGRLLGRHRHPQMSQLPLATSQAAANLAQRMRTPQLEKRHGQELAPTGQTPRVALGFVLLD